MRNWYVGVGIACMVAAIAVGLTLVEFLDNRSGPPIIVEDPRVASAIVVSVEGAVARPGTYTLTGDARLQNALDAAGGPVPDADLSQMNLAQRLHDEERVVVPFRSQSITTGAPGTGSAVPVTTTTVSTLININLASAAELETLPQIGAVLAERIVAYRTENGPFLTVDQLAAVDGISASMVDDLRALITV